MLPCPYCLSDTDPKALVCKVCTRDVSLVFSLKNKIQELENNSPNNTEEHLKKIQALEDKVIYLEQELQNKNSLLYIFQDFLLFILAPFILILMAHSVITILLDTKIIYLRILTIVIPIIFGYFLFNKKNRSFFTWLFIFILLSIALVLTMSGITGLIDDQPILPKDKADWRDFIYFATSIVFGFVTGSLLGILFKLKNTKNLSPQGSWLEIMLGKFLGLKNPQSNKSMQLIKKYEGLVLRILTFVSTVLSIYSGLSNFIHLKI